MEREGTREGIGGKKRRGGKAGKENGGGGGDCDQFGLVQLYPDEFALLLFLQP